MFGTLGRVKNASALLLLSELALVARRFRFSGVPPLLFFASLLVLLGSLPAATSRAGRALGPCCRFLGLLGFDDEDENLRWCRLPRHIANEADADADAAALVAWQPTEWATSDADKTVTRAEFDNMVDTAKSHVFWGGKN